MLPLISICMATYNGEKYLKEQIESVIKQSYKNFELIIQDDNSTDNTLQILQEYADLPNISIFVNETNLGYIKNFETLLQRAQGEYIAISDQDDIWQEDKLDTLLHNIQDATLIYSNSLLIDAEGKSLKRTLSQKLKNNFISSSEPLNFLYDNTVSAHAVLFKRELLAYLAPLPTHLYFDQYIAMLAASLNGVKFIDKNLVEYRQHNTNTLSQNKKQKLSTFQKIHNKLAKKEHNNQMMLHKIQELRKVTTLSQDDRVKLQTLQKIHESFKESYFNFQALSFFLQNRDILFKITTKNSVVLSFKKSIGYKLYKAFPLL